MSYKIVEWSPEAHDLSQSSGSRIIGREKYPWNKIEIGQSFTVPFDDANADSLRTYCYYQSKRLNKTFRFLKHEQFKLYEIARFE
jgi:hypothetical protein